MASTSDGPRSQGRASGVAFRLRVGVTGHRDLNEHNEPLSRAVDMAIGRIAAAAPRSALTPIVFEIVSSLSEGADRLVVERMLSLEDASLEVPLPFPIDEYEQDFDTEASRSAFRALLARAETWRLVATTLERPTAYEEAGRSIVDGCDVLLAVWDKRQGRGPGGTEDIVAMALDARMWVVIVDSEPPHAISEVNTPKEWPLFRNLERFNRALVAERTGASNQHSALGGNGIVEAGPRTRQWTDDIEVWLAPYFEPADLLAQRARRDFLRTSRAMAALAVAAVAVVAIQITFAPERRRLALLEVLCMVLVLGLWASLRGKDFHARWVSTRFFAERLRAAACLALVGADTFPGDLPVGMHGGSRQEWMTRAFREIWRLRPRIEPVPSAAGPLARYLKVGWIDEQLDYYRSRGYYHATLHRLQLWTTGVLFVSTVLAATLHALVLGEGAASKCMIVVSIVFPALGGALSWLDVLEEHRPLADRYGRVAKRLASLSGLAERISDLESVRRLATETELQLRSESAGWIDAMRYRDAELLI